ncbi:hypothetical protein [Streptomyces litchfieldiae]|uniref:Uncharacterized protein n=1 Tax=Streptomyces litchfieldiae TaxID=3075543 RepID=A0ABU2MNN1_9ACTN|nr:hypothetical protein [Streptomyces sp. DSM 44938]MDT0343165.1 hypothetical protein [Streptomyces sp. DSM 44938]
MYTNTEPVRIRTGRADGTQFDGIAEPGTCLIDENRILRLFSVVHPDGHVDNYHLEHRGSDSYERFEAVARVAGLLGLMMVDGKLIPTRGAGRPQRFAVFAAKHGLHAELPRWLTSRVRGALRPGEYGYFHTAANSLAFPDTIRLGPDTGLAPFGE